MKQRYYKQHKWHKEIKAWADGKTVQIKLINMNEWIDVDEWHLKRFGNDNYEFRIKPQPKEPQYFYVWQNHKGEVRFFGDGLNELPIEYKYIGKIKLEVDE